jgi:hypothetical protein
VIGLSLLVIVVALPFGVAAAVLRLGAARSREALRLSILAALVLVVIVSLAGVDVRLALPTGRALLMSPIAQLGIQLLALAMLGFAMSLGSSPAGVAGVWLTVAWLTLGGLILALLITSLPLALLAFAASALLWALALPTGERQPPATVLLNYAALLALAMPLLLIAFRLAEQRTSSTPEIERLVLALAVPGFGLILAFFPLQAWALTLASGAPRPMFFGVLSLVQTAGFILLLRTLETYPWMVGVAQAPLALAAALSAGAGGWLALSARRDDPDDWLVYALVAGSGLVLAGLATQSRVAGAGALLLLFTRVLALILLALAPRVKLDLQRLAYGAATLSFACVPLLAGFPGLWAILRRLQTLQQESPSLPVLTGAALLVGTSCLLATALRRWESDREVLAQDRSGEDDRGARRAIWLLLGLLVLLGVAPQLVAPSFTDALRGLFFPAP